MSSFKRLRLQERVLSLVGQGLNPYSAGLSRLFHLRQHHLLHDHQISTSNKGLQSLLGIIQAIKPECANQAVVRSGVRAVDQGFIRSSQGGLTSVTRGIQGGALARAPRYARGSATAALGRGGNSANQVIASIPVAKLVGGEHLLIGAIKYYGRCYWELSKPRLSMLVVTTAGVGFVMGSGDVVDWVGLGWMSLGTMMAAASANAFNQIMEVTNDSRMKRTMQRPLPSGRLGIPHAVAFAVTIGVAGITVLSCKTNAVTTGLGAANVLLYTLAYTPLKQVHPVNTWIGAVVGAIPPLMGWAAAAGQVDSGSWVLAAALYFWQIPHFMAIAFLCRKDYAAGGYKMLSLADASGRATALVALRNCGYLLPLGFIAQWVGVSSGYLGVETLLLSVCMGATAASFYLHPASGTARNLFRASLLYLPMLMAAMVCHRVPNPNLMPHDLSKTIPKSTEAAVTDQEAALVHVGEFAEEKRRYDGGQRPIRPPISFLSAAPFPFLPVPVD